MPPQIKHQITYFRTPFILGAEIKMENYYLLRNVKLLKYYLRNVFYWTLKWRRLVLFNFTSNSLENWYKFFFIELLSFDWAFWSFLNKFPKHIIHYKTKLWKKYHDKNHPQIFIIKLWHKKETKQEINRVDQIGFL